MREDMPTSGEPYSVLYDLRETGAWQRANRHRCFWGKLHTSITILDADHVLLTFRPAPDRRWARWEAIRKGWILREVA